jgi:hypothetical protein
MWGVGCAMLDVGCWMWDVGVGCAMLDVGCGMLDDCSVIYLPWASPTVVWISPFQGWVFCGGSFFLESLLFFWNHLLFSIFY